MMRAWTLPAALAILLSAGALGDEPNGEGGEDGPLVYFAAGGWMSVEQSLYRGGDEQVTVLPLVVAHLGPVYLRGPALGLYLYGGDGRPTVSTAISLDLTDTGRGDSPQLADMSELHRAVLGKLDASHEGDWGRLSLSIAADISGTHGGYLARLSYGTPIEVGRGTLEPELGVKWQSADVNRYYFGVDAADVTATRPRYKPDAGVGYDLRFTVAYPFAERHMLRLEVGTELVSDEISESPIVERDSMVSIGAGYLFRF